MKVNIGALKKSLGASLAVEGEMPQQEVDWGESVRAVSPIRVKVKLTNTGRCIVVTGTISYATELICDRCLQPFAQELQTSVEEEYFALDTARRPADEDGAEMFAEVSTYSGDVVDLTAAIREHALLALPYRALCKPDCAGLCPRCGQNLNEGKCGCRQISVDPRLADLARLLQNNQTGDK